MSGILWVANCLQIGAVTPLGSNPLDSKHAEGRTQETKAELTPYLKGLHPNPMRDSRTTRERNWRA